jgi:glycosyltransferase involved in cell wall biosynthesis
MNVLYVSHDGVLDPLGRSQVVPYVEGLGALGHRFDLISYEKPGLFSSATEREAMAERLRQSNCMWHPLPYHRATTKASTIYDLARGLRLARRLVTTRAIDLVHARSYPPALIASRIRSRTAVPFLFDMRGFYADERADTGSCRRNGGVYRALKRLETTFLSQAAGVVTLTEASVPVLRRMLEQAGNDAPLEVIPTCVDLERFRPAGVRPDAFTLAYTGSLGGQYMGDEMLAFAAATVQAVPGARLRLLVHNRSEADLRGGVRRAGVPEQRVELRSVPYEQMPGHLEDVSAMMAFIRPDPSKVASAPTKFSESMALGLPIAVTPGVGDLDRLVEGHGVGVVLRDLDVDGYRRAALALDQMARDESTAKRCRALALERFDVRDAVAAYDRLYAAVTQRAVVG